MQKLRAMSHSFFEPTLLPHSHEHTFHMVCLYRSSATPPLLLSGAGVAGMVTFIHYADLQFFYADIMRATKS